MKKLLANLEFDVPDEVPLAEAVLRLGIRLKQLAEEDYGLRVQDNKHHEVSGFKGDFKGVIQWSLSSLTETNDNG